MHRRTFIKTTICLGCAGLALTGCARFLNNNITYTYKSKKELPKTIHLEACSLCQLNCVECPVRKAEKYAPADWLGYLKFKDFKKFVDDNDFIERIELSQKGEIFLNPELDEIIEYAHLKNIFLTANTGVNLNTVSEKTLENLVRYKFGKLTVSLDGATGETYKIYRRGGDFDVVIDNIKKINYFKEKYNSEFPKLTWQFILFGHNEHEIELAKERARGLNMGIKFKQNYSPKYSPIKNIKLIEAQTGLKLTQNNKNKHLINPCLAMLKTPQIGYNGDLLGCHMFFVEKFSANVFKDGFLNAINSPDFIYAKKMLTDFSIEPKNEILCSNCYRYKSIKENKISLTH